MQENPLLNDNYLELTKLKTKNEIIFSNQCKIKHFGLIQILKRKIPLFCQADMLQWAN